MADSIATQAYYAAQDFADYGDKVVKQVQAKIEKHATQTVPVVAIGTALMILFKHQPPTRVKFLEHFEESAGYAFPCSITARELWDWINPPKK